MQEHRKVLVKDKLDFVWNEARFVGVTSAGLFACEGLDGEVVCRWEEMKEVTEAGLSLYSLDTFPKQAVWVRLKNNVGSELVNVVGQDRVETECSHIGYGVLLEEYEMSLDYRQTWQPAGEKIC